MSEDCHDCIDLLAELKAQQWKLRRVCNALHRRLQFHPEDREAAGLLRQTLHRLDRLNRRVEAEHRTRWHFNVLESVFSRN